MSYDWQGKVILVAEDNDANYKLLEMLLRKTNVTLLRATDGQQAVQICDDESSIDLVLMDLQMPIMNGLDATRIIKSKRSNLPVVAQTAFAMADEHRKSLEAGCDNYITKPINRQKLYTLIDSYLHP